MSALAEAATGALVAPAATVAAGGVLVDADAASGVWVAPNATVGAGAVIADASPAAGTWEAPSATVQTATFADASAAVGTWNAPGAGAAAGGIATAASAAAGTWTAPSATVAVGPVAASASPAIGAWVAPSATAIAGGLTANAVAASGVWYAPGATASVPAPQPVASGGGGGGWWAPVNLKKMRADAAKRQQSRVDRIRSAAQAVAGLAPDPDPPTSSLFDIDEAVAAMLDPEPYALLIVSGAVFDPPTQRVACAAAMRDAWDRKEHDAMVYAKIIAKFAKTPNLGLIVKRIRDFVAPPLTREAPASGAMPSAAKSAPSIPPGTKMLLAAAFIAFLLWYKSDDKKRKKRKKKR